MEIISPSTCPECGEFGRAVSTTTTDKKVYRGRVCGSCGFRWTTTEVQSTYHRAMVKSHKLLSKLLKEVENEY